MSTLLIKRTPRFLDSTGFDILHEDTSSILLNYITVYIIIKYYLSFFFIKIKESIGSDTASVQCAS